MDYERENSYWKSRMEGRDSAERKFRREDTAEKRTEREQAMRAELEGSTYGRECADCHFLYQPWLLPARSWEKLMNESSEHFGEDLALDPAVRDELTAFLVANATEHTDHRNKWTKPRKKGKKPRLMKKLKGKTPVRITELPYIVKEHDELASGIFNRPSIGSFSNCKACHTRADVGDYDEDHVKVPKR